MSTKPYTDGINTNDTTEHLLHLGWNSHFQQQLENRNTATGIPARVVGVRKNSFCISNGAREWIATVSGKLLHRKNALYPVTGDWVLTTDTVISRVLARKNALSRGAAGTRGRQDSLPHKEQVIAANLDSVFIVCGLDRDFNLRRIERYLTLVYNCGLAPVIILTKADLHQDPEPFVIEAETVAMGVPLYLVSAHDRIGLSPLKAYLSPGQTAAMVGSSGAGKSTLVNRLSGKNIQATRTISDSVGKGRHTTTTRDLFIMPQGGMVIDNPGLREISFWDDGGGIDTAFPEIEQLARSCHFSNCSHMHEPGCRVLKAVSDGDLAAGRLASYRKMKSELTYLSDRLHKSADRIEKERWKDVALKIKSMKKGKRHG